jgi:CheY-like chemotaxis protein
MNARPTVLYAEDDANDAFFMEIAFEDLKRAESLRIVTNGKKAIEYLTGAGEFADRVKYPAPTLLLLDVKMPAMSGLEVLAWVRARPEFRTLPVVVFSSSTQDADIEFCRAHGANAYLVKPSNADNLAALVLKIDVALAEKGGPHGVLAVDGNRIAAA